MAMKESKAQFLTWSILIILLLLIIIKWEVVDGIHLKKNHRYTIGTVTKIYQVTEGSKAYDLFYNINNKQYMATGGINKRIFKIGNKCYVQFYVKNPKNAKILSKYIVPDSILVAPVNGWDTLPTTEIYPQ